VQDGAKIYAQDIGYTAHGAITQMQLGNGLVEQWLYNSRLQPSSIRLGDVAGSDSAFGAALDYGATNNNGNLLSLRITGMGLDRTQTYQYVRFRPRVPRHGRRRHLRAEPPLPHPPHLAHLLEAVRQVIDILPNNNVLAK
jgi:hypothetical protein